MPKRRMTPARAAQIRLFRLKGSYSKKGTGPGHPFGAIVPGGFGSVRRHKLGGKGYQRKAGRVTVAPAAAQAIAGKPITAPLTAFANNTIRGDMTQRGGQLYRAAKAVDPADLGHAYPNPQSARGARKGLAPSLNSVGAVAHKVHPVAKRKNYSKPVSASALRNSNGYGKSKYPWGGK